jgi:hypothetical protein
MVIRSINDICANQSDKTPLIALRYCRQCKPDFESFAHEPLSPGRMAALSFRKKPPKSKNNKELHDEPPSQSADDLGE